MMFEKVKANIFLLSRFLTYIKMMQISKVTSIITIRMRTFTSIVALAILLGLSLAAPGGKGKGRPKGVSQERFEKRGGRYPDHPGRKQDQDEADFFGDVAVPKMKAKGKGKGLQGEEEEEEDRNMNNNWVWSNGRVPYVYDPAAGFSKFLLLQQYSMYMN